MAVFGLSGPFDFTRVCGVVIPDLRSVARPPAQFVTAAPLHFSQYQSEFARKHISQGREEGRAREVARAARAVLAVFEARDMVVPGDVRERIEACDDLDVLERWHKRAVKVESPAEIFEGSGPHT